jgi:hypothetical protein
VAEDLGTWPPEQATVLLDALAKAGLSPRAKRTRHGVVVTVDDDQAADAHRTLLDNMDAIARAARKPAAGPRRQARSAGAGAEGPRPLTSQRLTGMARPLGILLLGLLVATIVPPLRLPVIVFTVAALVYVLGRQSPDDPEHR